jgi:hypothetical protein
MIYCILASCYIRLTRRARVPYLYPPATGWPSYTPGKGSHYIVSYDSQGYGGGFLTLPQPHAVNVSYL